MYQIFKKMANEITCCAAITLHIWFALSPSLQFLFARLRNFLKVAPLFVGRNFVKVAPLFVGWWEIFC